MGEGVLRGALAVNGVAIEAVLLFGRSERVKFELFVRFELFLEADSEDASFRGRGEVGED